MDLQPTALQLRTVRDAFVADPDGTVARVKAAGFTAVELAPVPPGRPARLAGSLARHALAVVSIHGELPSPTAIGHCAHLARECRCAKLVWYGWPRGPRFDSLAGAAADLCHLIGTDAPLDGWLEGEAYLACRGRQATTRSARCRPGGRTAARG